MLGILGTAAVQAFRAMKREVEQTVTTLPLRPDTGPSSQTHPCDFGKA